MSPEIENIKTLEEFLNKGTALTEKLDVLAEAWEEYYPEFKNLMSYYSSPQWIKDVEASDKGLLKNRNCGVLSQDAVYNLYTQQRELIFKIMRISLTYLEDK